MAGCVGGAFEGEDESGAEAVYGLVACLGGCRGHTEGDETWTVSGGEGMRGDEW